MPGSAPARKAYAKPDYSRSPCAPHLRDPNPSAAAAGVTAKQICVTVDRKQ